MENITLETRECWVIVRWEDDDGAVEWSHHRLIGWQWFEEPEGWDNRGVPLWLDGVEVYSSTRWATPHSVVYGTYDKARGAADHVNDAHDRMRAKAEQADA